MHASEEMLNSFPKKNLHLQKEQNLKRTLRARQFVHIVLIKRFQGWQSQLVESQLTFIFLAIFSLKMSIYYSN